VQPHTCDARCAPHVCTALSAASVRVVHSILSGALTRAVKWHWIAVNPALAASRPHPPRTRSRRPWPRLPGSSRRPGWTSTGGCWSGSPW
jgi:hypothetical protein